MKKKSSDINTIYDYSKGVLYVTERGKMYTLIWAIISVVVCVYLFLNKDLSLNEYITGLAVYAMALLLAAVVNGMKFIYIDYLYSYVLMKIVITHPDDRRKMLEDVSFTYGDMIEKMTKIKQTSIVKIWMNILIIAVCFSISIFITPMTEIIAYVHILYLVGVLLFLSLTAIDMKYKYKSIIDQMDSVKHYLEVARRTEAVKQNYINKMKEKITNENDHNL